MSEVAKLSANARSAGVSLVGMKRKVDREVAKTETESEGKENLEVKKQKLYPDLDLDSPAIKKLQETIDKECKMRDGAAKLLQAAKNSRQSMEASKGLFVSNQKVITLMQELQEVKKVEQQPISLTDPGEGKLIPCTARIAISEIRIPLEWREFENIRGKFDSSQKLGVFCLFRMGNQVMDTVTMAEVDRSCMDIAFTDTVIFPQPVDPDFVLKVEVYCSVPATESHSSSLTVGKTSTPIKMLRKIRKEFTHDRLEASPFPSSASSSTLQSSPTYVPPLPSVNPSHHFALAGHAQFTRKDITVGSCQTYTLTRGIAGSSGTAVTSGSGDQPLLPLWGQICCCLMAEPACAREPRISGFLNIQQMVTGLPAWLRLWAVLRQNHLRCWTYPEDVGRKMPVQTRSLTKDMQVENAPRLTMRRPNTIIIKSSQTAEEVLLSFESKEEKADWGSSIKQAILDLNRWGESCDFVIPKQASKFYSTDKAELDEPLPLFSPLQKQPPPKKQHSETVL